MQMPNQLFNHIITNCHDHVWVWIQKKTKAQNPFITKLIIVSLIVQANFGKDS